MCVLGVIEIIRAKLERGYCRRRDQRQIGAFKKSI
jgi:hypothetical protein